MSLLTSLLFAGAMLSPQSSSGTSITMSISPKEPYNEENFMGAIRESLRLGVNGAYISVKWGQLESNGPLSLKSVTDQMGIAKFVGGNVVLSINAVDTNVRSLPPDLMNRKWDDPMLVDRWTNLLEQIVPLIPKNVTAIALGNEVDAYFMGHKSEWPAYEKLIQGSRTFLRSAGVKVPVGVITTHSGYKTDPEFVTQIQKPWATTFVTYYPMTGGFKVQPSTQVPGSFDDMLKLAAGRPLHITEMGCPASPVCGSSEAIQSDFVRQCFEQIRKNKSGIASANYFMQHDFPSELLNVLESYYGIKDETFRGYLGSLGLRSADGKPRAALKEFRKQLGQWNLDHDNL